MPGCHLSMYRLDRRRFFAIAIARAEGGGNSIWLIVMPAANLWWTSLLADWILVGVDVGGDRGPTCHQLQQSSEIETRFRRSWLCLLIAFLLEQIESIKQAMEGEFCPRDLLHAALPAKEVHGLFIFVHILWVLFQSSKSHPEKEISRRQLKIGGLWVNLHEGICTQNWQLGYFFDWFPSQVIPLTTSLANTWFPVQSGNPSDWCVCLSFSLCSCLT